MNRKYLLASIVGFVLLALVPVFTHNPYYIHLVETIMIYAILLFGLDIVVGYTGQVSLGHAGLFGIGAYTAGVLFMKLGAPFWVIVPASIACAARVGSLFGDGDHGVWHHHPNLDQRNDLPHRRPHGHQDPQAHSVGLQV
jgi:branched-chain amino acid transport system permease protein